MAVKILSGRKYGISLDSSEHRNCYPPGGSTAVSNSLRGPLTLGFPRVRKKHLKFGMSRKFFPMSCESFVDSNPTLSSPGSRRMNAQDTANIRPPLSWLRKHLKERMIQRHFRTRSRTKVFGR